jgi:predicted nucleotidyltransferase
VDLSDLIARHGDAIRASVHDHHASMPRVIGSVARGAARPDSDVDFLVDFDDEATLLDEIGLRLSLSDLIGRQVDVLAMDQLRGVSRERILRGAVSI